MGKKSPAEKCHLQPDTGARAFTNLPVTLTAWQIATLAGTELNRRYKSCKKFWLLRFLSSRQVKGWGHGFQTGRRLRLCACLSGTQAAAGLSITWGEVTGENYPASAHLLLSTAYFTFTNSLGLSFFLCLLVIHQTLHLFALVFPVGYVAAEIEPLVSFQWTAVTLSLSLSPLLFIVISSIID